MRKAMKFLSNNRMNHFSIFSVCLFVFYSSFSFCQEFDKELSADYRRKSDSLLEIGKYESAAAYLSSSFSYEPRELRTRKYLKEYKKKMSYLDSLIDCCVTDSMRCRYRLELALYYSEKGYGSRAYSWFGQAEDYCNNSEYFKSNLMKLFSPTIPDTVWVNNNEMNFNGFEIIRSNLEQNKFYETPWSLENVSNEIVHLRRDTSLFSGVIIMKSESHRSRYTSIGSFKIWHVQNGKLKYHIQHLVFNDPKKNSIKTTDPAGKEIMKYFDDDHYYSGVIKNNRDTIVEFYPNGDTLSKSINTKTENVNEYKHTFVKFYPNGDTLSKGFRKQGHYINSSSISYYPDGDPKFYSSEYKTDTNTLVREKKSWDENNNLIYKSSVVRVMDKSLVFDETIHFNKYGDTIEYSNRVDKYGLQGIQYIPLNPLDYDVVLKEPYVLKAVFSMDSLQTILNPDIIFLDKRFRKISESEFLKSANYETDGRSLVKGYMNSLVESYEIDGVTYNAVACLDLKGRIKKLRRKLKRMK